jgi:hypothetical protein
MEIEIMDLGLEARPDHRGEVVTPFDQDLCQIALLPGDLEFPVL